LIVGSVNLGPRSFWSLGIVTVLAVVLVLALYKELKVATFDPALAAAVGLSPVLVSLPAHGGGLRDDRRGVRLGRGDTGRGVLVVPPATAYLLTERLSRMMALAVALGLVSAVAGYHLAALFDVAVRG
jgi:manganese/zinc/iron transport system permease protein